MYDLDSSLVSQVKRPTASLSPISHGKLDFLRFIELHARSLGNLASSARRARHLPARLIPLVPGPRAKARPAPGSHPVGVAGSDQIVRRAAEGFIGNPGIHASNFGMVNGTGPLLPFLSGGSGAWCDDCYCGTLRVRGSGCAVLGLVSASFGVCTRPAIKTVRGSSEDLAIHSTLGAPW
jgi:hypothetical protein